MQYISLQLREHFFLICITQNKEEILEKSPRIELLQLKKLQWFISIVYSIGYTDINEAMYFVCLGGEFPKKDTRGREPLKECLILRSGTSNE